MPGKTRGPILLSAALAACLVSAGCAPAPANSDLPTRLQRLADAGNAEALYHLGMMHQTGSGLPKDHAKALAAFRQAAAKGDPLAAYQLGSYLDGREPGLVAPEPAAALLHKLVAAQAGYALAQQDVALIYARSGAPAPAREWLDKALAQGWTGALSTAATFYDGTPGIPKDPAKATAYLRLLATRIAPDPDQRRRLADLEASLTPADRARAAAIVRAWRPAPTALTRKALSGQRAAEALVRTN